jgi:hypothetical protein
MQGWEITPKKMTSRFDYYGSGITLDENGIVLKFVDPKDTTANGSARKVYYVTINKDGLKTSNKYEE